MHYLKIGSIFLILLVTQWGYTQIINVESLRRVTDTSGWSGNTSLDFSITKNTNTLIRFGNKIHVQYKTKGHLILFVNNLNFERAAGENFVNQGSQHLRYNYKIKDYLAWEAFLQSQNNSVAKINFRGLAGTGLRFKILGKEKFRLYMGALIMYEHEELDEKPLLINRDFRSSTYASFSWYPTNNISVVSTSYYQPLLSNLSDFRFATENSLVVGIVNKLSLKTTYTLTYDEVPATEVPHTFYQLSTGLLYSFD